MAIVLACGHKIFLPRLLVKEPSPWQSLNVTNNTSINQSNVGFLRVQLSLSHVRQLTQTKVLCLPGILVIYRKTKNKNKLDTDIKASVKSGGSVI